MTSVLMIQKIRLALAKGLSARQIAKDLHVSRNTVRKVKTTQKTKFLYKKRKSHPRSIGVYTARTDELLEANEQELKKKCRLTGKKIWETIKSEGCEASYETVLRYIRKHKKPDRAVPS